MKTVKFPLKLRKRTLKLIFNLFIFALTTFAMSSAVPVSVILDDEFSITDGNVTHVLTAYEAVNNVTIIDYFSGVEVQDAETVKEEFMGREWNAVKIPAGDMEKEQLKLIKYKILRVTGDAMLGADVYYIEGERHQLFPKNTTFNAENNTRNQEIINESINRQVTEKPAENRRNYLPYLLGLAVIILLVAALFKMGKNI